MSGIKRMIFCALCIAIGVVLPIAFHSIPNGGGIFLPMHIPVLICGLICGPLYGLCCGLVTPLLSTVITGMPAAAILPAMLCELAVFGLAAGLAMSLVKLKSDAARIYIALIIAMLCGRVVYGLVNAFVFNAGAYTTQMWLTVSFVTCLPGIVIQLVVIPLLVLTLKKAGLVEL